MTDFVHKRLQIFRAGIISLLLLVNKLRSLDRGGKCNLLHVLNNRYTCKLLVTVIVSLHQKAVGKIT